MTYSAAAKFIVEQLEDEDPTQYRAIFSKLLTRAQEEDDHNIIYNHYLQIKTIMKMSESTKLQM